MLIKLTKEGKQILLPVKMFKGTHRLGWVHASKWYSIYKNDTPIFDEYGMFTQTISVEGQQLIFIIPEIMCDDFVQEKVYTENAIWLEREECSDVISEEIYRVLVKIGNNKEEEIAYLKRRWKEFRWVSEHEEYKKSNSEILKSCMGTLSTNLLAIQGKSA